MRTATRPCIMQFLFQLSQLICCIHIYDGKRPAKEKDEANPYMKFDKHEQRQIRMLSRLNQNMAFQVYKKTANRTVGSILFSPYTFSRTLAVVSEGLVGDSKASVLNILNLYDFSQKYSLAESFKLLEGVIKYYSFVTKNQTLLLNSNLYYSTKYELESKLTEHIAEFYEDIDIESVDEDAAEVMNDWAEKVSQGYILPLVNIEYEQEYYSDEPDTSERVKSLHRNKNSDETLVIAMIALHAALWQMPFPSTAITMGDFMSDTGPKQVPVMQVQQVFRVGTLKGVPARIAELPFAGSSISMTIVVPLNEQYTLSDIEQHLEPIMLLRARKTSYPVRCVIELPKFTIRQSRSYVEILQDVGLEQLFDASQAQMMGFVNSSNCETCMHLGQVYQSASLFVNEAGTLPGRVSQDEGKVQTSSMGAVQVNRFPVKQPFMFIIHDQLSGTILLMGRFSLNKKRDQQGVNKSVATNVTSAAKTEKFGKGNSSDFELKSFSAGDSDVEVDSQPRESGGKNKSFIDQLISFSSNLFGLSNRASPTVFSSPLLISFCQILLTAIAMYFT